MSVKDANILILHTNNVNTILQEIEKALEEEKQVLR